MPIFLLCLDVGGVQVFMNPGGSLLVLLEVGQGLRRDARLVQNPG
jgi:hypothetical protein